jgi:hypothetical protein
MFVPKVTGTYWTVVSTHYFVECYLGNGTFTSLKKMKKIQDI